MQLNEFEALSPEDKYEYILKKGRYIGWRSAGKFNINLYAIDNFYCEAFYDIELNTLGDLLPFKGIEGLEPYMDQIQVKI